MPDKLDLSLPPKQQRPPRTSGALLALLVLVLIVGLANLV